MIDFIDAMKSIVCFRMNLLAIVAVVIIFFTTMPDVTHARPSNFIISNRQKRVSDQRVAELETLLALAKMRGKLVTVPVGFGNVDPVRMGRKRRSSSMDHKLEKLQRLLQAITRESESASSEDSDEKLPSSWNNVEDGGSDELTEQLI